MTNAAKRLSVAALLLSGCLAAAAQNAPGQGNGQGNGQDKGQAPPPAAEPGTTVQTQCIAENDGYKMSGKQPMFVIEIENKCEQRMKCRVFAYVTSAKGAVQGQGTIVLAPKSRGAAAKKSFTMKAKMIGGSSQSMRECRAI